MKSRPRDPVVAHLVELVGPIRHRPPNPTGTSARWSASIVFQQLAGARGAGHPRAGPGHGRRRADARRRSPRSPTRRCAPPGCRPTSWRRCATSRPRSSTAPSISSALAALSDDEIVARLVTVRGIGRWTAEMYLMFELRRLDVWPVDDLGVRQGYGLAWGLDPPPTAEGSSSPLGDRFRPYRSVVARYCWEAVALFRGGTDPSLR